MGIRRDILRTLEAGVMGLFLIQAIRFLYGTLYAHASSADLTRRIADQSTLINMPGYIELAEAQREIYAVAIALLAPLLALLLWRIRWSLPLAVALAAVGRMLALQVPDSAALAAALVVGAGLLYLALVIMRRPRHFPSVILLGLGFDQLIRAGYVTIDPTWNPDFVIDWLGLNTTLDTFSIGVAVAMVVLAGYTTVVELEASREPEFEGEIRGTLSGWSSIALGAFLFVELALFGLANVVARWADVDYYTVVTPLIVITFAPLVPEIRKQAGNFIASFDGQWRGWVWMLTIGLLLVLAHRFTDMVALGVLIMAQLMICLTLWWMIRPHREESITNPTPILLLISVIAFGLLSAADYFTYDYAYVRDFDEPFSQLDERLRSFRDLGLQVFLFSTVLLALPMILERRIIPWRGGREGETFVSLLLLVGLAFGTTRLVNEPPVIPPARENCFRVATLNIHSGYTLLFEPNIERIGEAIRRSGADVVLLQEVDTGRLSSFGVDQATWLAHELNMDLTFFPQNEFVQGLATLSRIPINDSFGDELPSTGAQAASQHVILDFQGQPIHIYNVWLGFQLTDASGQPLPANLQDQNRQTDALQRLIAANHGPGFTDRIVMGGTFNYDITSNLYQVWDQTTFEDPFVGLDETRDIKTIFLVDGTSARFDYIWLMNLIPNSPNGVGIDQQFVVSDHRLAVAEIILDPTRTCEGVPVSVPPPPEQTPTDEPQESGNPLGEQ
jgi:endonuclease/exonuclease/phosphatase family metal-dependent hydrolase